MIENKELGKKLAVNFNKKYGIITYSGTLAIEVALISLNLKPGSKVLVLSEVCYSIVNTILKLDLVPIIVESKNQLYLTNDDVEEALKQHKIECIMLVHQYGIYNYIDLKKYRNRGIKIIEDASQTWGVSKIGKGSDIVVTSFGKTKPLSFGIGGALFFDNEDLFERMDYCDISSREKEEILLSYAYPLCNNIKYEKLIAIANKNINQQKKSAKKYSKMLQNNSVFKYIEYDYTHAWHRFPIWVSDYSLYKKIVNELKTSNLDYQLSHEIELKELRRNKECIKFCNKKEEKYIIFLRTRNVRINNQLKVLKKIINKIVL